MLLDDGSAEELAWVKEMLKKEPGEFAQNFYTFGVYVLEVMLPCQSFLFFSSILALRFAANILNFDCVVFDLIGVVG